MAFQSQQQHQQVFSRRRSSAVLLQNATARSSTNTASTPNSSSKKRSLPSTPQQQQSFDTSQDGEHAAGLSSLANVSSEEEGLENALHLLSEQVDSDVDLLQHLEDDFRADLERMELSFEGAFGTNDSNNRDSMALVNVGQLLGLLSLADDDDGSFSNTAFDQDDLSSDIGGSIGDDTNLEQTTEEMQKMLQMVDMEFMEQDRMKFRHPEEEILFRKMSETPDEDNDDNYSFLSEVDENEVEDKCDDDDEDANDIVHTETPSHQKQQQCMSSAKQYSKEAVTQSAVPYSPPPRQNVLATELPLTARVPPEQFVYETPQKSSPPNPPPKDSTSFSSFTSILQCSQSIIRHSLAKVTSSFGFSFNHDPVASPNIHDDESNYRTRQLMSPPSSSSPTATPSAAAFTHNKIWNHQKKLLALSLLPIGLSLVMIVGAQVQYDSSNECATSRGRGEELSTGSSFVFTMGSIFQYREWVDMAMNLYGGE